MIRKTIFWTHLIAGVITGIVIFSMSVTGVLLTYERQILQKAREHQYVPAAEQLAALTLDDLFTIAAREGSIPPSSILLENHPGAPVGFRAGREVIELNPYTGEQMHIANEGLESLFSALTSFHRWFSLQGDSRNIARMITGASNFVFLFLVLSGIYLWLPSAYKWVMFRSRLLFNARTTSAKARDYNWHHVFGFWSAVPLVFVVSTALVFSYPWANRLVYSVYGEQAPVRARTQATGTEATPASIDTSIPVNTLPLSELAMAISSVANGWRSLNLSLPESGSTTMRVALDYGNGAQPQLRETLSVNTISGVIEARSGFSDMSPGQRTRNIIRYLHTGEVLGFWGQTIAGLVSLTSLLMVWTGLALAWRRLVSPLFQHKARARRA